MPAAEAEADTEAEAKAAPAARKIGAAREPKILDAATVVGMSHDGPRHDYTELAQLLKRALPANWTDLRLAIVSHVSGEPRFIGAGYAMHWH